MLEVINHFIINFNLKIRNGSDRNEIVKAELCALFLMIFWFLSLVQGDLKGERY